MCAGERMSAFDDAFEITIGHERGYSLHSSDPGGETNHGITARVAREAGYHGPMHELTLDAAKVIARERYWDTWRGDDVAAISAPIAREIFDTLYNGGNSPLWLQRCLNALNRGGADYPDLKADGRVGPATLNALRIFKLVRGSVGERVMVCALNCIQGNRFIEITENNERLEDFTFGWIKTRVLEVA